MNIDYKALSDENLKRYGTDIGDWAPELLANLYQERTHFVFELLQNAEDALRKRVGAGSCVVRFELRREGLEFSHCGKPFDESNVRGICGINKSTKRDDLTAIGRFGIGFKSVYAVTDRPEIRSAGQQFAIESFVHPVEIKGSFAGGSKTTFWLPFKPDDALAFDEIAEGLNKLGSETLLFLRHVEEIEWQIEGGAAGSYCRESREARPGLRRITLIGSTQSSVDVEEEEWLVFSRPALYEGNQVGFLEIAYSIDLSAASGKLALQNVADSMLSAFFPTNVPTGLGIRLQAPYKTTPARDNVPFRDPWNQYLIKETASLLIESLEALKSQDALTVEVLRGLPIDEAGYKEGSMFRPLYVAVAEALRTRELLPAGEENWLTSSQAALARGQGLRDLVDSAQLTALLASDRPLRWLSDDITLDRTPELRSYLMKEHDIPEIQPQNLLPKVMGAFLEEQSDEWICRLYSFLLNQPSLMKSPIIAAKPWVRLEDGTHVVAFTGRNPNAYLPSRSASGFPTVRTAVSMSEESLNFLKNALNLTEPDPVDDVIANVLPLYKEHSSSRVELDKYREHLKAIESAYGTPLSSQRDRLVAALRTTLWVSSIDNAGSKRWLTPSECYLSTDRLKSLFSGIDGIAFVDDAVSGLSGEAMRNILIASGAPRYLATVKPKAELTPAERRELRRKSGDSSYTRDEGEDDRTLRGLGSILAKISALPFEEARMRCGLLWEALADVVQDRREGVVKATYSWFYYSPKSARYDAAFIRTLKESRWVPTAERHLARPSEISFEDIEPEWVPNAVLQTALNFQPSVIAQLAQEMGLETGVLSFLKMHGITSVEILKQKLKASPDDENHSPVEDDEETSSDGEVDESTTGLPHNGKRNKGVGQNSGYSVSHDASNGPNQSGYRGASYAEKGKSTSTGRREFVSYLSANPLSEEEGDLSDAVSHEERMQIEAAAIKHILNPEPGLHRTPAGNAGFDLFGTDDDGNPDRWVEVKAMVGTLTDHPVGMSRRQFEFAQEKRSRFWLYIVEQALSDEPRILKIQDPAGSTRTFTFDSGWGEIAEISQVNVKTGETR